MTGYLQRLLDTAAPAEGLPVVTLTPVVKSTSPVFEQNQLTAFDGFDAGDIIATPPGLAPTMDDLAAEAPDARPIAPVSPTDPAPDLAGALSGGLIDLGPVAARLPHAVPAGIVPPLRISPAAAPLRPVVWPHTQDGTVDAPRSAEAATASAPESTAVPDRPPPFAAAVASPPPLAPVAPERRKSERRAGRFAPADVVIAMPAPRRGRPSLAEIAPAAIETEEAPSAVPASPTRSIDIEPRPPRDAGLGLADGPTAAPMPAASQPRITIGRITVEVVPDAPPAAIKPPRPVTAEAASVIGPLGQPRTAWRLLALRRL